MSEEESESSSSCFEKCLAFICISLGLYFLGTALYNYWSDDQLCTICYPNRKENVDSILVKSAVDDLNISKEPRAEGCD